MYKRELLPLVHKAFEPILKTVCWCALCKLLHIQTFDSMLKQVCQFVGACVQNNLWTGNVNCADHQTV